MNEADEPNGRDHLKVKAPGTEVEYRGKHFTLIALLLILGCALGMTLILQDKRVSELAAICRIGLSRTIQVQP